MVKRNNFLFKYWSSDIRLNNTYSRNVKIKSDVAMVKRNNFLFKYWSSDIRLNNTYSTNLKLNLM